MDKYKCIVLENSNDVEITQGSVNDLNVMLNKVAESEGGHKLTHVVGGTAVTVFVMERDGE